MSRNLRRADRWTMGVLATAGVLLLGSTTLVLASSTPPPVPTKTIQATVGNTGAVPGLSITFAGDTMLADAALSRLESDGYDWPFAQLNSALIGDIVIANAEAPLTNIKPQASKQFVYAADPRAAAGLKRAGIDVLALANNHVMDAGAAGLQDTIRHAEEAGLATYGAGSTRDEAAMPLLIDAGEDGKVAVLGFGENFGRTSTATTTEPGMLPFTLERITRGLEMGKAAGAHTVIAYVHWGTNYGKVDESQRYWAQQLVDAGYDLVVGAGSHALQPLEIIDGVPVIYSLGNFVFTTPGRYAGKEVTGHGAVATVTLGANGAGHLLLTCLEVDNLVVEFQPRPCPAETAATVLGGVHPGLEIRASSGTFTWQRTGNDEAGD
ncbi:CapA family protein [Paeniglutamicibacter psychrophenolicus]|uniref:Capsule synthesis protein CapA domain-containing protein n=1 Tax=Paeniglutamicibacter psychrophenolicus TaxID=257454 RepID=A0ABS4WIY9_9MICC|nr:CapA family protein [Paeniglutamicibacter psychrophenolicus]MBP2376156.1 hypothetical protein [Paeniglutamicibacter psychrophenolicus]